MAPCAAACAVAASVPRSLVYLRYRARLDSRWEGMAARRNNGVTKLGHIGPARPPSKSLRVTRSVSPQRGAAVWLGILRSREVEGVSATLGKNRRAHPPWLVADSCQLTASFYAAPRSSL